VDFALDCCMSVAEHVSITDCTDSEENMFVWHELPTRRNERSRTS
jgi:hypothetical protein